MVFRETSSSNPCQMSTPHTSTTSLHNVLLKLGSAPHLDPTVNLKQLPDWSFCQSFKVQSQCSQLPMTRCVRCRDVNRNTLVDPLPLYSMKAKKHWTDFLYWMDLSQCRVLSWIILLSRLCSVIKHPNRPLRCLRWMVMPCRRYSCYTPYTVARRATRFQFPFSLLW